MLLNESWINCFSWLDVTSSSYPGYFQPSTHRHVESHVDPGIDRVVLYPSVTFFFDYSKTCTCANVISWTQQNKIWEQVVSLEVVLERRTMTSIPEISARGSLFRELSLRYQSVPDQAGRERAVGP